MNKKVYVSPSIDVMELQGSCILNGSSVSNMVSESDDGISITFDDDMECGSAASARVGRNPSVWDSDN